MTAQNRLQRLDGGELGHPERHLHAPVLAQGQFLGEQGIDDLQGTCLAAFELAHSLVQDFQSSRHLQPNESFADAIEDAPAHRKMARIVDPPRDKPILILRTGDVVAARPLDFYQAVGRRLACQGDQP